MPELRSGTSTATLDEFPMPGGSMDPPRSLPVHATPPSDDDGRRQQTDDEEQVDASPRCPPRRPAAPDLEDALNRLTQTEWMAAIQQRPAEPERTSPGFQLVLPPLSAGGDVPTFYHGCCVDRHGSLRQAASGPAHREGSAQSQIRPGHDQRLGRHGCGTADTSLQRLNVYAIVATHG